MAVAAALWCSPADAGDAVRYGRDGKAYLQERSTTEFAVKFADDEGLTSGRGRLASMGIKDIRMLPGQTGGRWRIVEVDQVNAATRDSLAVDPMIESVQPVWRRAGKQAPCLSTGGVVIKFRPEASPAQREALLARYGLVPAGEDRLGLNDVVVLRLVDADAVDMIVAAELFHEPEVLWAQSDLVCPTQVRQTAPQDTFFSQQWHLANTGQGGGTIGADIDVLQAWKISQGGNVLVGMFDDSCDVTHEDLFSNYSGLGNDLTVPPNSSQYNDPRPKDRFNEHGTPVMGLIVAAANTIGVRGVAPLAQFSATRGVGAALSESTIAQAFSLAAADGVAVHCNSWGFTDFQPHPVVEESIENTYRTGRVSAVDGRPRGMVVLFATGNFGIELQADEDLSMLPFVIGVGASDARDRRAEYSNFGNNMDIMAPSNGAPDLPQMVTTDNMDASNYPDDGYNSGGVLEGSSVPDLDNAGNYTKYFGGTSAACPVATGVAALVVSVNPQLTASQVRSILVHTSERIAETDAQYRRITRHSKTYGYGRVNAAAAVQAAKESTTNGNKTWPGEPKNIGISKTTRTITWKPAEYDPSLSEDENNDPQRPGLETVDYLIVESLDENFDFVPQDGVCYVYDAQSDVQIGCSGKPLGELPEGVTAYATKNTTFTFTAPPQGQVKYFALYARNVIGRYSYGVALDSEGGGGGGEGGGSGGGGGGGGGDGGDTGGGTPGAPQVTINVQPLSGVSPLTVSFQGNALVSSGSSIVEYCCPDCNLNGIEDALDIELGTSVDANLDGIPDECPNNGIDVDRTKLIPCPNPESPDEAIRCSGWDFETDGNIDTFSTTTTNTYRANPNGPPIQTFRATLTFTDTELRKGSQFVDINVRRDATSGGGDVGNADVSIAISTPGTMDQLITSGTAPLTVRLNVDVSRLPGTFRSVFWDLGDGSTATSLSVLRTYQNKGTAAIVYPISVTVYTTVSSGEGDGGYSASTLLTVFPEEEGPPQGNSNINGSGLPPGGGAAPACGLLGMTPLAMMLIGLALMRRRFVGR